MEEKRHYPRFNTSVKVQDLTTHKTRWTKNLSLGGCLMEKSEESDFLPMTSNLVLKLEIPGANEPVVAYGKVRHEGEYKEGYGIQFKKVDEKTAYYIERFMGLFL